MSPNFKPGKTRSVPVFHVSPVRFAVRELIREIQEEAWRREWLATIEAERQAKAAVSQQARP